MNKQIIILAAGKGARMKATLPKVMHKVAGIPMVEHVIKNCLQVSQNLILVYSDHLQSYLPNLQKHCKLIEQRQHLGTAHAVAVAKSAFLKNCPIAVIYADNPLINSTIISNLFNYIKKTNSKATTLAFEFDKANQYGRIVVDNKGNFTRIVEAKFASKEEKKITLCNSGVMAFAPGILEKYIDKCLISNKNASKKELYLTEIIEICTLHDEKVSYFKSDNHNLLIGVNTQDELANANNIVMRDLEIYGDHKRYKAPVNY